jgi:5-methylcytosine-specific restriction endonuclease McrA
MNIMELNKVYFCDKCMYTTMLKDNANCPNCNTPMEEIGFIEDGKKGTKGIGGSTKPGLCACGEPRASKGLDEQGRRRYRTQCYKCLYQARLHVKATKCRICGITPKKKSDLHLDHIDGNRSNNSVNNIQTLCVQCHKYKTNKQQDWKKKNV